ncbi:uncharacterized protein L201_006725 [Kwoniella dendrophila CBS 6074]|uniref:Uncharacterized protein n=1 Tax=Kwoniella dendrophila CBS 6074 TaxID=1295534 RepID=A0AAX4K3N0_9TREE
MGDYKLDDASDLIQYGGDNWGVDHKDDLSTPKYYEATFHTTTVHLAWSRICWEGGDINVYGAKRDNHGLYAVSIDNGNPEFQDGFSKEDVDYASFNGNPISCDELPENTVTPSDPSAVTPTTAEGAAAATSSATDGPATNTDTAAGVANSTSVTIPAFSANSTAAITSSTITPTTTATVGPSTTASSSIASSVSSSAISSASASATNATSAAQNLVPEFQGQIALVGLAGYYLFKLFA